MNISLFYFLAFLAILSALMVVISKNPVHSVLYLFICFFAIAGHCRTHRQCAAYGAQLAA